MKVGKGTAGGRPSKQGGGKGERVWEKKEEIQKGGEHLKLGSRGGGKAPVTPEKEIKRNEWGGVVLSEGKWLLTAGGYRLKEKKTPEKREKKKKKGGLRPSQGWRKKDNNTSIPVVGKWEKKRGGQRNGEKFAAFARGGKKRNSNSKKSVAEQTGGTGGKRVPVAAVKKKRGGGNAWGKGGGKSEQEIIQQRGGGRDCCHNIGYNCQGGRVLLRGKGGFGGGPTKGAKGENSTERNGIAEVQELGGRKNGKRPKSREGSVGKKKNRLVGIKRY